MNVRTVVAAAVVLLAASGCGGGSGSATPAARTSSTVSSPAGESISTAEGTVVAYYSRLGRHDIAGAAQLLEPGMRREYLAAGPDGEFVNTVSISNIRNLEATAAPPTPGGLAVGYRDITQVFLTYDAVYRQVVAADDGPNSRFVYVGRNASGQWRILEIGTGP